MFDDVIDDDGEVGRVVCEKCGNDLGPIQPLRETLTFCVTCQKWVGNDGREHQIRREVKKDGRKADVAAGDGQSEEKKGRTKKHKKPRRRIKCV